MRRDADSEASPRLADRLAAARQRHFVGRQSELELFRSALQQEDLPFSVLHIYGPGGVGKTTLLSEYARLAEEAGRRPVRLDGRDIQSSPHGFTFALSQALGLPEGHDPIPALSAMFAPVLLIDSFETIESLDAWFRESLLPALPGNSLTVVVGRKAPSAAWRSDPGWTALTRIVSLRNLRPEESRALLASRGVTGGVQDAILSYTHGHPLALALAAAASTQAAEAGEFASAGPDVVRTLLERFVDSVPSALHRNALETTAVARATTQEVLAGALEVDDASAFDLFMWLSDLPIVERGRHGLFPHDIVREIMIEDLRWRNADWLAKLSSRISLIESSRFFRGSRSEQHLALWNLFYLNRRHPTMERYYDWSTLGASYAEPARPEDRSAILAMVARHEGPASVRIAEHWLDRQPERFEVLRSLGGQLSGFAANIAAERADERDEAVDPAIRAVRRYVERYGPVGPGEGISLFRFWMDSEGRQTPAAQNLVATLAITFWMTEPRLAWAFAVLEDPDFWEPMFAVVNIPRAPEADFVVGNKRYGVVAHDWRKEPPMVWWSSMRARRDAALPAGQATATGSAAPTVVLSQPEFANAVRQALRDFVREDALTLNPLINSRLVTDSRGGASAVEALRSVVREAVDSLNGHPRDQKLYRALRETYIHPAPTQEAAAELLGLPFSTYRRHLTAGIERVTEWLWRRELYGRERA